MASVAHRAAVINRAYRQPGARLTRLNLRYDTEVTRCATLNGNQSVQLQQGSAQLTVEQHTQRMGCHLAVQA